MKFRIALPGTNHIPPANDHVPEAAQWATRLTAPDFQRIASVIDDLRLRHHHHVRASRNAVLRGATAGAVLDGRPVGDVLRRRCDPAGPRRRQRPRPPVPSSPEPGQGTVDDRRPLWGPAERVDRGGARGAASSRCWACRSKSEGPSPTRHSKPCSSCGGRTSRPSRGRYFQIDGLAFEPKPVQTPRPPIYVGGNSKPALRRAARFDGWEPNPTEFSVEEMPPLIDYIRSQPDFAGKEETFEISWVGTLPGIERPIFADLSDAERADYVGRLIERLEYVRGLGATTVSVPLPVTQSAEEYLDFVRWFDQEVIAKVG